MGWPGWQRELLVAMGIKPTRARLDFLSAWQQCEGGHARFNPLNTTEAVYGDSRYNTAGVRDYADSMMGLAATLLTLRLPAYQSLRAALRDPGLDARQIAARGRHGIQVWGTDPRCVLARASVARR